MPLPSDWERIWSECHDCMVTPPVVSLEMLDLDRQPLGSLESDLTIGWCFFMLLCDVVDE